MFSDCAVALSSPSFVRAASELVSSYFSEMPCFIGAICCDAGVDEVAEVDVEVTVLAAAVSASVSVAIAVLVLPAAAACIPSARVLLNHDSRRVRTARGSSSAGIIAGSEVNCEEAPEEVAVIGVFVSL
jgi:hypothetical protein